MTVTSRGGSRAAQNAPFGAASMVMGMAYHNVPGGYMRGWHRLVDHTV
jgi:hypothetical protein